MRIHFSRSGVDAEWPRSKDQMPIEGFIADFACVEAKLIVELDGGQHALREVQDRRRTEIIGTAGYIVLRFWNAEVLSNTDGVIEDILATLALRAPGGR